MMIFFLFVSCDVICLHQHMLTRLQNGEDVLVSTSSLSRDVLRVVLTQLLSFAEVSSHEVSVLLIVWLCT